MDIMDHKGDQDEHVLCVADSWALSPSEVLTSFPQACRIWLLVVSYFEMMFSDPDDCEANCTQFRIVKDNHT